MFYLRYVRSELIRRRARTILTLAGLAVGVALVIAISGLSRGLDRAQKTALNPLSTIGTDLTVTLSPQQDTGGFGPGGGGGAGRDVVQANQSAVTDLSKLGKPGDHFVHDFFLPGTQLTFQQQQAKQVSSLSGVASVTTGLVLSAVHQEGVVPKIVAKIKTGGDTINVFRRIKPPTAAEFNKMQACLQKAGAGGATTQPPQQGFGGGGARTAGGPLDSAAARKCLPTRLRQLRTQVTTPEQTLKQVVDPPQTNIKSSSYTIAGVDPSQSAIGLVTASQIASGRFIKSSGAREALLAASYAKRQSLKLGSKLDLNGTTFTVVGLVKPPLGGQSADVYVPLSALQTLADQTSLANVILVRADSSADVSAVQKEIEQTLGTGAQVASAKQVADSINGSLVDAANLAHSLGLVLAILAAAAAFLLAVLLTLSSVGKRVREIGTLKALGWSQRLVVRQIVAECLVTGVLGGLIGVGLGVLGAAAVDAFGPSLSASTTTGGGDALFGLGSALSRTATASVSLDAPLTLSLLALGFVLAVGGGLIAGTAGALRAGRLRPADALRQVD